MDKMIIKLKYSDSIIKIKIHINTSYSDLNAIVHNDFEISKENSIFFTYIVIF